MNFIKRLKAKIKLKKAIMLADEKHAQTGERYYVMPSLDGMLLVMDRKSFRKMKMKHYITKDAKVADMVRESFYFTPYGNGSCAITGVQMERKRNEYFFWVEAMNKKKKKGK